MRFAAFTWHVPAGAFLEHACTLFLFTIFLVFSSKFFFAACLVKCSSCSIIRCCALPCVICMAFISRNCRYRGIQINARKPILAQQLGS